MLRDYRGRAVIQTIGNATVVHRERVQRLHQASPGTKIGTAKALAEDSAQRGDAARSDRTAGSAPAQCPSPAVRTAGRSARGSAPTARPSATDSPLPGPSTAATHNPGAKVNSSAKKILHVLLQSQILGSVLCLELGPSPGKTPREEQTWSSVSIHKAGFFYLLW